MIFIIKIWLNPFFAIAWSVS